MDPASDIILFANHPDKKHRNVQDYWKREFQKLHESFTYLCKYLEDGQSSSGKQQQPPNGHNVKEGGLTEEQSKYPRPKSQTHDFEDQSHISKTVYLKLTVTN